MEQRIRKLLSKFSAELPKFEDGRINYSNAKEAFVLSIFVYFRGKILLLKRSNEVASYKELWDSVAGYYDSFVEPEQKVFEELEEELGITKESIASIGFASVYTFYDKELRIRWHILPVLVELKYIPEIRLNFEHTAFKWIFPKELRKFKIVPKLEKSMQKALSLVEK